MCNCGRKSIELQQNYRQTKATTNLQVQTINFEYIGKSSLTIIGNATKKTYRFLFPGDLQAVDYHDAPYFLLCPLLKR